MSAAGPLEAVFQLEASLGTSWASIRAACEKTKAMHASLAAKLEGIPGEDVTVVLLGSGGRFELTRGSDPDWTYLVDGQANVKHHSAAFEARDAIHEAFGQMPGREAVFGGLTFSHDLIHYVGGEDDTNANLTRRILLLLESKPVGRRDAYDRVIQSVLERYLSGDKGWMKGRTPHGVPRFLLNDFARYWRTVTVDYVYKQWSRGTTGWALRNAKLRMSRKLIFASGLLMCFFVADPERDVQVIDPVRRRLETTDQLARLTNRAPLDLLADAFTRAPGLSEQARVAFDAYEEFLVMLGDPERRSHLDALSMDHADDDAVFQQVRDMGRRFQSSLTALFTKDDSPFRSLTMEYGIF